MNRKAWMLPREGIIDRSLDLRPEGHSSRARARPRNIKRASVLVACAAVAVIVASMAFLSAGDEPTETAIPGRPSNLAAPQNPYYIYGYTNDSGGVPVPSCTVTITNVDNGGTAEITSGLDGRYMYNLANMGESYPYADGDEILVEAEKDMLSGSAVGYVDLGGAITLINVTLEGTPIPEFPMLIAPVAGIMALFVIVRSRRRKPEA